MRTGRLARWLIRRLVEPGHADDVLGDLYERYGRHAEQYGERRARRTYRRDLRDLLLRLVAASLGEWFRRATPSNDSVPDPVVRPGRRPDAGIHPRPSATWSTLLYDVRIGVRTLRTAPLFAAAVIVTLSLGIGANTAIFSTVSTLLFQPLGYPDEDRLAVLSFDHPERGLVDWGSSYETFLDLRDQTATLDLTGITLAAFNVRGRETAERVGVARVSSDFWRVAGVSPALGRGFTADEDQPGGPSLVVLSHELWSRQFGADTAVLGTAITMNGTPHTVIGIMPPGFRLVDLIRQPVTNTGPTRIDAFVHLASFGNTFTRRARIARSLARVHADVSLDDARAELETVYARLAQTYPEDRDWVLRTTTLRDQLVADVRPAFLMALGAAGLILVLACVNIASLVLVRGTRRQDELALRRALGGSRAQVIRQLLIESSILGVVGGVVGAAASVGILHVVAITGPESLAIQEMRFGLPGFLFAFGLSIVTSIAIGIIPALSLTRRDPVEALRRSGARVATGSTALRIFVVAEVALALTLLTSAGHLARSFGDLAGQSVGHRTEGILTMALNLSAADYPADADVSRFIETLEQDLGAITGVEQVSSVSAFPPQGPTIGFTIVGHTPSPEGAPTVERQSAVTPAFFDALDIPLVAGRTFTAADDADAPPVVIISEALARRHYGDADPVGTTLIMGSWRHVLRGGGQTEPERRRVIGVVGDVREVSIDGVTHIPMLYQPHAQDPWRTVTIALRTAVTPAAVLPGVRSAVARLDRGIPLYDVRTMAAVRDADVARERFLAGIVGGFAGLAVILAAFGIYAVIAYTVSLRTREIGIRLALGARPGTLLNQLMRAGVALVALGIALGVAASAGAQRVLSSLLFELSTGRGVTLVVMVTFLAVVAAAAVYIPARRVASLDAAHCLRTD